ncbi:MAG: hypothetical protein JST26_10775 [Bacteroidetes bacterium]|nr:hypothetical protein [Bacteroidota bacterium]
MKFRLRILYFAFLFLLYHYYHAQTTSYHTSSQLPIPAEFPGGKKELYTFIYKNISVPDSVKNGFKNGFIRCNLRIDSTGHITGQDIYANCDACKDEMIKVIKRMPVFKPATENNKNINSVLNVIVSLKPDPDSLIFYKPEYLYGEWVVDNANTLSCIDCPRIHFNKDLSCLLMKDSLVWQLNNKKLDLQNKNKASRKADFIAPGLYSIQFRKYYQEATLKSGNKIYRLYRKSKQ